MAHDTRTDITCTACGEPLHVLASGHAIHIRRERTWRERAAAYRIAYANVRAAERIIRAGAWAATRYAPTPDCAARAYVGMAPRAGYRPVPAGDAAGYYITPRAGDAAGVTLPAKRPDTRPLRSIWTPAGEHNRVPVTRAQNMLTRHIRDRLFEGL